MPTSPNGAVFLDHASYATVLVIAYIDEFGTAALHWDPRTIQLSVDDVAGGSISDTNFAKLMAAIAIVTTDRFFVNLRDFLPLCRSLCGGILDPTVLDFPEIEELAWGITEALLLSDQNEIPEFDPEIRAYIGEAAKREGILDPPDVLAIATGLNPGLRNQVISDYADQPQLQQAIVSVQESKNQEITEILKTNLTKLFAQLGNLQLDNGDTSKLLEKLAPSRASTR